MAPSPMKSPNAIKPNLVKAGRNLYDYRLVKTLNFIIFNQRYSYVSVHLTVYSSGILEHPFNFQVFTAVLNNYILLMSQKELIWLIDSSVPKPNSEGFKQLCNGCLVMGKFSCVFFESEEASDF